MKLGTQTNSLTNHLYSRMTVGQPEPKEGMGCTILAWTDRYAGTITFVGKLGRFICVREDDATRVDKNGMSDSGQVYEYKTNNNGRLFRFRKTRAGTWQEITRNLETGRYNKVEGGHGLLIGHREKYHDFSF